MTSSVVPSRGLSPGPSLPADAVHGRRKVTDLGEQPRLLLVGPRILDGRVPGGAVVHFEAVIAELQRRARVQVCVVDTARPLANRHWLERRGLDARAFVHAVVRVWRRARTADLVVWYVSPRAAILVGWVMSLLSALRRSSLCVVFFGDCADAELASAPALWRWVALRAFHRTDLLLCQTRRLTAAFGESFRTAWLPNTRNMPSRRKPYRECCRRLLFLSRLRADKGLPELLEAASRFPDSVRLSVFGTGTPDFEMGDLERAPNVTLHGEVSPARVPDVMDDHDVVVLPTRWYGEGYSGVVIEAFQMGLPVIVTPHLGLAELVTHERDGLFVEPGSVDALVAAIGRIAADDELFQRLRRGALETGQLYRSSRAAAMLEELCRSTVANSSLQTVATRRTAAGQDPVGWPTGAARSGPSSSTPN